MKTLLTSIAVLTTTATASMATVIEMANGSCQDMASGKVFKCGTSVPEISALEGTAALAALAAIVFIAWERRRRAA